MKTGMTGLAGALLMVGAAQAGTQDQGCVLLETVAEIEQTTADERGEKNTQLVPVERVVPGNGVIYTFRATNICDQTAEDVVIDSVVPQHMTYVAHSAIGPGTAVTFSIDGGIRFGMPETLKVQNADGSERRAQPNEYTNIRWVMRNPLKPGAVAFARFRAVLE